MSNIKPLPGTEIYIDTKKRRVYTTNLLPGKTHFMERLRRDQGKEFREWDPTRSKLAAAVMKGAPQVTIKKGDIILYLGISHGYTASFISDIIGDEGIIFGVDSALRIFSLNSVVCLNARNFSKTSGFCSVFLAC